MSNSFYRDRAVSLAGQENAEAVEAIARHLHYNESLHLHDNVESSEPCAYCWLRAGKALWALRVHGSVITHNATPDRARSEVADADPHPNH